MAAPTSPERWKRLENLFHQAAELEPESRGPFLDHACGGDTDLRAGFEALLLSSEARAGFIQEPLQTAARNFYADREPAPLSAGSRLAHYRIVSLLGAGGMGR